jgi:peptidoglycan/LPS O-acetylase OafA/YrhL
MTHCTMLTREISQKRFQIDALDGLRGFAALLVIFSHTSNVGMHIVPFLDFRGTGKCGVYLFFLLSSFLLSIPLLHKHDRLFTAPVLGNYWLRRVLRIYPLYTLYLLSALVSTCMIGRFLGIPNTGVPYVIWPREFLHNFLLLETKGVTWSIAVEFKFYIILPVLVLFLHQFRKYGMGALSLAVALMVLLSLWIWPQSGVQHNDVRLGYYLPIFLAGTYLAILHLDIINNPDGTLVKRISKAIVILAPIAAAALVLVAPAILDTLTGSRDLSAHFQKNFLFHAVCWSLVLMGAIHQQGWLHRFFNHRFLRSCGALSFSIYLFHMPLISMLKRTGWDGTLCGWIVLLVTLVTSYASFRLIEGPMSRLKWPMRKSREKSA